MVNTQDMNLHEKVHTLASEVSEKFVPNPTNDDILSDVLMASRGMCFH